MLAIRMPAAMPGPYQARAGRSGTAESSLRLVCVVAVIMLKMRNADGASIFFLSYRVHMKIMEAVWPLTALCVIPPALAACAPAARTAGPHRAPGSRARFEAG